MNYHHKTISLHGAASKKYAIIFSERSFSWGTKCFAQKIYGEGGGGGGGFILDRRGGRMIRSCQGRGVS